MPTSIRKSNTSEYFSRPALRTNDRIAYTPHQHCILFTAKLALIPIFLLRRKKTVAISTLVFPSRTLSHPTVTDLPTPPASPLSTDVLLHYLGTQHRSRFSRWSASSLLSCCCDTRPPQIPKPPRPQTRSPLTTEIHPNPTDSEYERVFFNYPKKTLFFSPSFLGFLVFPIVSATTFATIQNVRTI
jgi:hypothetical protein